MLKRIFIFSLILMLFCSCDEQELTHLEQKNFNDYPARELFKGVKYRIVTIDSCEYIFGMDSEGSRGYSREGLFLTHKGNCKFCNNRNNNKSMGIDIEDLNIDDILK